MKSSVSALVLSLVAVAVAGCGSLPETKKIDYKSSAKAPSLEIPPDLSQIARDERYTVPDVASAKGSATYSAYSVDRSQTAGVKNSNVLPEVDKVRVERSGNQRWLVVTQSPEQVWDTVKEFWQETGFIVELERPEAGVMETDWAEDRAKIQNDLFRQTVGKLLDSLYSTGLRDKFRTRLEPGAMPGTTDIFISHRGMEEVYTNTSKDDTRWQPRSPDPELEAEMLRRLMVRLGSEEKRAEVAVAATKVEPKAKMTQMPDGAAKLVVLERFDRAWRRVGLALDRVGFTVEDRDRNKGLYYVRYVDPDLDNKPKEGLFSRMFSSSNDKSKEINSNFQYKIWVEADGTQSVVQVVTNEGGVDQTSTAKKILGLLQEQLK